MDKRIISLRKEIVEVGKRAFARGFVASHDGNISARVDRKHILITPSGVSKGFMKTADLIVVDINGKVVSGKKKPSTEMQLHLTIYARRPDVESVCHMHPVYATAFAVAGLPLEEDVLSEAIITLGKIPLVPYGTPGTEEISNQLIPHLENSQAFLLANHGALTVGTDVFDAYGTMETLEHYARILFLAKQLGPVTKLNPQQLKQLVALRNAFGIKKTGM